MRAALLAALLAAPPDALPAEPPAPAARPGTVAKRAPPPRLSNPSGAVSGLLADAARAAAARSKAGDYAGAAAHLEEKLATARTVLEGGDAIERATKQAGRYRERAALAARATGPPAATRRLTRARLAPGHHDCPAARAADPRIGALLAELRKVDPAAEQLFGRKVRVEAPAAAGLDPIHVQLVVDGAVHALRALGVQADTAEGADVFTLTLKSPTATDTDVLGESLVSGNIQAVARWTSGGALVLGALDVGATTAGFSADAARTQAAKKAGEKVADVVLAAWLKTQPAD